MHGSRDGVHGQLLHELVQYLELFGIIVQRTCIQPVSRTAAGKQ